MAALTAKRCPRLMSPCRLGPASSKAVTNMQHNSGTIDNASPVFQPSKHIHSNSDKTSDILEGIRKQIRNVSKLRDNLTNAVTYLGAIHVEVPNPGRYLPDYQKFIPSISFQKKKEKEIQTDGSVGRQKEKLKTSGFTHMRHNTKPVENEESDSFEKAINDTHESVDSYCKSASTQVKMNRINQVKSIDKAPSKSEESDREDDSILGMFAKAYKIIEPSQDKKSDKIPIVRKDFVSRADLSHRTKSLVQALKNCSTDSSRLVRTEELCKHLLDFPESRSVASKEGVLPTLLRLRKCPDANVKAAAREGLALIGYIDPVKGRGVRILTVDGGGTKGLVAIETLKKLEEACKTDITELFDFVCGVSTGALILAMVFMFQVPLDQCEHLYKELSLQMFTRNKFVGTGKLVWNHAFYDTEIWEKILKENLGEDLMIALSRDPNVPKMACFSCLMNAPKLKNFIFRNYNLPPEIFSQYPGNCKQKVWEAIRASSAAPGYYEECKLGDFIHQDGGILTNNPSALAIHEGKLLWPQESIQCVISLGNGRHEPSLELSTANKVTLKDKVSKIVDSATDTEAVHTTLQDLMAPSTYYRFNPYLSEEFMLDEIRPEKQEVMQRDTQMYLRKNDLKLQHAASQLLLSRRPHQKTADWLKLKADMM